MMRLMVLQIAAALVLGVGTLAAQTPGSGDGTVAETMNVGSYVYIRLEEDGTWLATSQVEVAVGDRVEYAGAFPMSQFYSQALDRTFEEILFVGGVKVDPGPGRAAPGEGQAAAMHGGAAASAAPEAGELTPLEGGLTIGELVRQAPSIEGQQVALRARATKVTPDILGKNWITLQDGTGQPPADRLIATTAETVDVGETVVVRGTVRTDVDLGYGYSYAVLLEEATFSR